MLFIYILEMLLVAWLGALAITWAMPTLFCDIEDIKKCKNKGDLFKLLRSGRLFIFSLAAVAIFALIAGMLTFHDWNNHNETVLFLVIIVIVTIISVFYRHNKYSNK